VHARKATPTTILVQITAPEHATARYTWDEARGCLRFAGLAAGTSGDQEGDLGIVVAAPQVCALVVGLDGLSLAPSSLVECTVIGGARDAVGRLALMAAVAGRTSEERDDSTRAHRLITAAGLTVPVQWLDAETARAALHEALGEAHRTAPSPSRQQSQPAWKVLPGVDYSRAAIEGLGIFDAAPALLEYIPYRFQLYLAAHLRDDERVLFFVERQEAAVPRGRWLGRQHVLAGLLLITDQRVLIIEDRAPPNLMLKQGSYQVEVIGMGRLAAVALHPSSMPGYRTLTMTLAAQTGQAVSSFDLPKDLHEAGEIAIALLRGFLPAPVGTADRRVRRVVPAEALQPSEQVRKTQAYVEQLIAEPVQRHLTQQLRTASAGLPILACAMTPAMTASGVQAVLLASDGLYHTAAQGTVHHIALATIAKATYVYSLVGCKLMIGVPYGEQVECVSLSFAHVASDLYNAVFTALCLALHTPYPVQEERSAS
jgi:hypothetical protein